MADINKVADFFISICQDSGDLITNLRLQKLVYYAQAWHLALFEKPLFEEDFQAWVHGPVVPSLYKRFASYKWNPISGHIEKPKLTKKFEAHLLEVMNAFGRFNAYELEQMTHNEEPWRAARNGLPIDAPSKAVVSKERMKEFYRNL